MKKTENSHCPPSSECVPDQLQGRLNAAKGEDWAPPFICLVQDTMGSNTSLPRRPYLYIFDLGHYVKQPSPSRDVNRTVCRPVNSFIPVTSLMRKRHASNWLHFLSNINCTDCTPRP